MKWFKHLSAARDDERIAQLEDVAGLEGYGFYFKLLEIVAASMDQSDRCEVGYSISRWASLTNCHPIKARTLVGKVASCGLVEQRLEGDRLVVRIPNLLKFRDNHTKNLQVACKQEVDVEVEKEKTKTRATANAVALPAWVPQDAWSAFVEMRIRIRAPLTDPAKTLALAKLGKLRDQGHDPRAVLELSVMNGWRGLFPLKTEANPTAAAKPWDGAH